MIPVSSSKEKSGHHKQIVARRRRLIGIESDFAHLNHLSMVGELATSLSHEITLPTASARNNALAALNFLDKQPPDLGEIREALAGVMADVDRVGRVIDRIREYMKKSQRRERFDLNTVYNEALVLVRSATMKNRVSVRARLGNGLLSVYGDRVQLQQVFLHLINNAIDAMSSIEAGPRELLVGAEHNHTDMLVAVRDSGPGIAPWNLDRVFEAFYTTKSNCTGVGLSICRRIINDHGGRLWAEANEPRGAIFRFTLPTAP